VPLEEFGDFANARRVQSANVRALAYRVITRNGEFCGGQTQIGTTRALTLHLASRLTVSSLIFERDYL